jgi:hypothetical protein
VFGKLRKSSRLIIRSCEWRFDQHTFEFFDIITYSLNLASCSEHFISIKHRILATFNINKKIQFWHHDFNSRKLKKILFPIPTNKMLKLNDWKRTDRASREKFCNAEQDCFGSSGTSWDLQSLLNDWLVFHANFSNISAISWHAKFAPERQ